MRVTSVRKLKAKDRFNRFTYAVLFATITISLYAIWATANFYN
jgi:hypothetical protein